MVKKIFAGLFLVMFMFFICSPLYAENNKSTKTNKTAKKSDAEETTDKFFKNIIDSVEKTTEDSVKKISKDIKEIQKDK